MTQKIDPDDVFSASWGDSDKPDWTDAAVEQLTDELSSLHATFQRKGFTSDQSFRLVEMVYQSMLDRETMSGPHDDYEED